MNHELLIQNALFYPHLLTKSDIETYHQLLQTNEEVRDKVGAMITKSVQSQLEFKQSEMYANFSRLLAEVIKERFDGQQTYTLAELLWDEFGIVLTDDEQTALYAPHEEEDLLLQPQEALVLTRSANEIAASLVNKLANIVENPQDEDECSDGIVIRLNKPLDFTLTINVQNNKLEPQVDVEMPCMTTKFDINFDKKLLPGRYYCEITPNTTSSDYETMAIKVFVNKDLNPNSFPA